MWAVQILMAVIGLSAGMVVAGGLFSFISGLGVISDFSLISNRRCRGGYACEHIDGAISEVWDRV